MPIKGRAFELAKWSLYIPPGYDGTTPCALMVFQDGAGFASRKGAWRVPVVLDNLIHRKELPLMAAIFVSPGVKPLAPGEAPRKREEVASVQFSVFSGESAE